MPQLRATNLGNFGWILAQQVHAPEDLLVSNYNGKGRMGLSPGRKHAIEEAAITVYSYGFLFNCTTVGQASDS